MATGQLIQPRIQGKLDRLKSGIRTRLAREGVAWIVLCLVALVFATLGLDYLLRLEKPLRAAMMLVGLGAVAWMVWRRLITPLSVPVSPRDVVMLVEKRYNELGDRLASSLLFSGREDLIKVGMSEAMIAATADKANALAEPLNFDTIVEQQGMKRMVVFAFCSLLLLGGFSFWQQKTIGIWFNRNVAFTDAMWPQDTYLKVRGGQTVDNLRDGPLFPVMRGDDFCVEVSLEPESKGQPPQYITVHSNFSSLGTTEEKVELNEKTKTYVKTFTNVSEEFSFYVTGGDDFRKKLNVIKIVPPPEVQEVKFTIEYPGYMNQPMESFEGSRLVIEVPVGGTLTFAGTANKELSGAALVPADPAKFKTMAKVVEGSPKRFVGSLAIPKDNQPDMQMMKFVLTDIEGHQYSRGQQYMLRVKPDLPPIVEARKKGVGTTLAPEAQVPLDIIVRDDYVIGKIRLMMSKGGNAPIECGVVKLPPDPVKELNISEILDLKGKNLAKGDVIEIFVEASDTMPQDFGVSPKTGPNTVTSPRINFKIADKLEKQEELYRMIADLWMEFQQTINTHQDSQAKVFSVAEASSTGPVSADLKKILSDASILESTVGAQCSKHATSFEAIIEEMINNRVDQKEDTERYRNQVIKELRSLVDPVHGIQVALKNTEKVEDSQELTQQARRIQEQQISIKAKMDEILMNWQEVHTRGQAENKLMMVIERSGGVLIKINEIDKFITQQTLQGTTTKPADKK